MSQNSGATRQTGKAMDQWEFHLKNWEKSHLSKADYCRQNDIVYTRFLYWIKRLRYKSQDSPSPVNFIQLKNSGTGDFLVSGCNRGRPSDAYCIRITVGDMQVEVKDDFSSLCLARVLHTLRNI